MSRGLECDDIETAAGDGCNSEGTEGEDPLEDIHWRLNTPGSEGAGVVSRRRSADAYKECENGNLERGDGYSRNICPIECGWTGGGTGANEVDVCAATSFPEGIEPRYACMHCKSSSHPAYVRPQTCGL
jgi:hypothetical protein